MSLGPGGKKGRGRRSANLHGITGSAARAETAEEQMVVPASTVRLLYPPRPDAGSSTGANLASERQSGQHSVDAASSVAPVSSAPSASPSAHLRHDEHAHAAAHLPEHEAHAEAEEHEQPNPVFATIGHAENAHLLFEAATEGKEELKHLALHAAKFMNGSASNAQIAGTVVNMLMHPLSISAGIAEIIEGFGEFHHDAAAGLTAMLKGGAGASSGALGIFELAGMVAPGVSTAFASGAAGVQIGQYSDKRAKELGVFHDANGRPETGSKWAAEGGEAVHRWVTEHTGSRKLGRVLGAVETTFLVPTAAFASVASATGDGIARSGEFVDKTTDDAGAAIGKSAAHHHRVAEYAELDATQPVGPNGFRGLGSKNPVIDRVGFRDPTTGEVRFEAADSAGRLRAAEHLAAEDDKREEAIAVSKALYPERWGKPANPLSIMHRIAEQSKNGGST